MVFMIVFYFEGQRDFCKVFRRVWGMGSTMRVI